MFLSMSVFSFTSITELFTLFGGVREYNLLASFGTDFKAFYRFMCVFFDLFAVF